MEKGAGDQMEKGGRRDRKERGEGEREDEGRRHEKQELISEV